MDTRLIRTFSMASSVPVLACCRRSDSRAREKNSRRNKNEGRLILPVPPYPPPPVFAVIFIFLLWFYKTKRFAVFYRNFRVISMRFAVFLCYSVRYLRVFLCSFAVLVPPLRPLQTLLFLTRLPTRQDSVENGDKVYYERKNALFMGIMMFLKL